MSSNSFLRANNINELPFTIKYKKEKRLIDISLKRLITDTIKYNKEISPTLL